MKKIFALVLASLVTTTTVTAQNINENSEDQTTRTTKTRKYVWNEVMDNFKADVPASYTGGDSQLIQDIFKNLAYPASAIESSLQGVVMLEFIVDTDGTVAQVRIRKSLSPDCDKAAVDAIGKLKRFKPARQNGKKVPAKFMVPIRFHLQ